MRVIRKGRACDRLCNKEGARVMLTTTVLCTMYIHTTQVDFWRHKIFNESQDRKFKWAHQIWYEKFISIFRVCTLCWWKNFYCSSRTFRQFQAISENFTKNFDFNPLWSNCKTRVFFKELFQNKLNTPKPRFSKQGCQAPFVY